MFQRIRTWTNSLAHRVLGQHATRKSGHGLRPRGLQLEPLERRELLTVISGVKWNDLDADGVKDPGEAGLAGWTMYVDSNQNGQLDSGELSTVTAADGSYSLSDVTPGTVLVNEVKQAGWDSTMGGNLTLLQAWRDGVGGVDGMYGACALGISPDGAHIYVAAYDDASLAVFSRNAATGLLTFVEYKTNGRDGVTGLSGAEGVVVSPDGNFVYVAGEFDSSVAVFRRNPTTGTLTFVECKRDGSGGVDGLGGAAFLTMSPDGNHVYAVGLNDNSVAVFSRNPTTGTLTFVECKKDGSGGVDGLSGACGVAISPDGRSVYVAGYRDNAVAAFSRNLTTGALTYMGCSKDGSGGVDGLEGAAAVTVSPDGGSVYVASYGDDAVAVFSRNAATGALSYVECKKDGSGSVDGLDFAIGVAISPDGSDVYVTGYYDAAVAVFRRNPATGALTFVEYKKDGSDGVSTLYGAWNVLVSPDGADVYVAAEYDDAITAFGRRLPGQQRVTIAAGQTVANINFGSVYTAFNTAPVVTSFTKSVPEEAVLAFGKADFTGHFTDSNGDSLVKVKMTGLPAHGTLLLSGTAVAVGQEIPVNSLANLTYQGVLNYDGPDSFTWNASDGLAYAASAATVSLTISAINDAPTLDPIANPPELSETSGVQTVNLTGISAGGGESQTLQVTATSSNPTLIANPTVSYTSPDSTGSLSFSSLAGQSGTLRR
jgi:6-phosphogluconolactonase (cycloisomerase 2 family)